MTANKKAKFQSSQYQDTFFGYDLQSFKKKSYGNAVIWNTFHGIVLCFFGGKGLKPDKSGHILSLNFRIIISFLSTSPTQNVFTYSAIFNP